MERRRHKSGTTRRDLAQVSGSSTDLPIQDCGRLQLQYCTEVNPRQNPTRRRMKMLRCVLVDDTRRQMCRSTACVQFCNGRTGSPAWRCA